MSGSDYLDWWIDLMFAIFFTVVTIAVVICGFIGLLILAKVLWVGV